MHLLFKELKKNLISLAVHKVFLNIQLIFNICKNLHTFDMLLSIVNYKQLKLTPPPFYFVLEILNSVVKISVII